MFCSIVRIATKSWAFDSSAAPALKALCRAALGFRVGLALGALGFLEGLALGALGFLVLLGVCVGALVRGYLGALDGTAVGFLLFTGDLLGGNALVGALLLGERVGERMGVGVGEEEGEKEGEEEGVGDAAA